MINNLTPGTLERIEEAPPGVTIRQDVDGEMAYVNAAGRWYCAWPATSDNVHGRSWWYDEYGTAARFEPWIVVRPGDETATERADRLEREITALKRLVVKTAKAKAKENGWCSEVERALEEMGLGDINVAQVTQTFTVVQTHRITVTLKDEQEALTKDGFDLLLRDTFNWPWDRDVIFGATAFTSGPLDTLGSVSTWHTTDISS